MPLKSIALFFEKRDVRSLQFLMEEQKLETRRKINALLRIERKLERRLAAWRMLFVLRPGRYGKFTVKNAGLSFCGRKFNWRRIWNIRSGNWS